jgi:hypothetical protein
MGTRRKYRKKTRQVVIAIRLDLKFESFKYQKWGGQQRAKRRDWLVDNGGDVYTVDAKSFARTYRQLRTGGVPRPGTYVKFAPVWAERAAEAGSIKTKEGESSYQRGDYIVYNNRNGRDGYCIAAADFKSMYRPTE